MVLVRQQLAATGSMVKVDTVTSGITGSVSTSAASTWTHTATAGSLVLVAITFDKPNVSVASYGGTQMAIVATSRNPNGPNGYTSTQIHALRNVPGGAQTVSVQFGGNTNAVATSISYLNTSSYGWPQAVYTGAGGSTSDTQSVTCPPGQLILSARGAVGTNAPTWSGGTSRYSGSAASSLWLSVSDASGVTTFTSSATGTHYWNDVALLLRPLGNTEVGLDARGFYATGNTTSISWSHPISTDAKAIITGVTSNISGADNAITAKVGTTSMTQLGSCLYLAGPTYWRRVTLFGLLNPPTGSQTVSVTTSGTVTMTGNSLSFVNVSAFGTPATNSGTGIAASTPVSLAVSSTDTQPVFASFTSDSGTAGYPFQNLPVEMYTNTAYQTNSGFPFLQTAAPGASTVTITPSLPAQPATQDWGAIGVPLIP